MMRVFYGEDGHVLFTNSGFGIPPGDYITVEEQDLGDLTGWRVVDGQLERAEDWQEIALQEARATASRTAVGFFLALKDVGILTPAEAMDAAAGQVPASITPIFDGMPPETQAEIVVRFRRATQFDRLDPYLALFAAAMGITDAQMDALFGVSAP